MNFNIYPQYFLINFHEVTIFIMESTATQTKTQEIILTTVLLILLITICKAISQMYVTEM